MPAAVSGAGGWSLPAKLLSDAHPATGGAIKLATYSVLLPATNPATAYTNDTTPPGATLDATDIKTAGAPSVDFTVTYTDDNDLDGVATRYAAGLDIHAVLVGGADFHFNYYPDFNLNGGSSNQDGGPSKTIIYRIFAFNSGTGWTTNDNGTYTISILPPQNNDPPVRDTTGNAIGLLTLGSFRIAIGSADTIAPTAVFAPNQSVPVAGQTNWDFSVIYKDNVALNAATIDGNDVRVTGPNGFDQLAALVSVSPALAIGSSRVATYRIGAPGGFWDGVDDGQYTISLQANQVRDTANIAAAAGTLGQINTVMPMLIGQSAGTVAFNGTAAADTMRFDVDATLVYFNLNDASLWYIPTSVVAPAAITGGAGNNSLHIAGGSFTLEADSGAGAAVMSAAVSSGATLVLGSTQHLSALDVAGVASLVAGGNKVLVVKSLAVTGTLDLFDNDLIVDYTGATQLAAVQSLINSARAGGAWTGLGLTSTTARNANPKNKTLGAIEASGFKAIYGPAATFAGESIDATAVLVKFTYYGDADFNGVVNFDDYSRTDAGFNGNRNGWLNGDFDGNGVVNFDDYSLIDLAFNTQGGAVRQQVSKDQNILPPAKSLMRNFLL